MLPIGDLHSLRPGDVLIHPTRGGALVDELGPDHVWLELVERLDRTEVRMSAAELGEGWRLAVPGGLFEQSVLRPEEASSRVSEHPGEALELLTEELGAPVDRELAATWLVSRGLLAPGRVVGWWEEALDAAASRSIFTVDEAAAVHLQRDPSAPPSSLVDLDHLRSLGRRQRLEQLAALAPGQRRRLLGEAVDTGDAALSALLVRWEESIDPATHAGLDRLASSGHRELALRLAHASPALVAPALLADARTNHTDGLCGEVLASLPPRRRTRLLMEILARSLSDPESLDAAEGLAEEYGGLPALQDRVEGEGAAGGTGPEPVTAPGDGRWQDALTWLRGRSSDTTMEMPSLHPTPLLRDSGRLPGTDAFPVSLSLARALARRHAQGRAGGLRGARLNRAEWRVDLGPAEVGSAAADVHDAMRLVLDLLVGRLAGDEEVDDDTLLAHFAALAPETPVDWIGVAGRALDPDPATRIPDGLALWDALSRAAATARVRIEAPTRPAAGLELGYDTHIGAVKARIGQTNQDALFFHQHGPVTLLLVADGISISSAGSGNLASALLVQAVATRWEEEAELLADADEPRLLQFLRDALAEGNRSVCETAWRLAHGDLQRHIPMGTTAVAALLRGGRLYLASLGDSRAYLVGPSGVAQLTGDGNLTGDWLRARQQGQPMEMEAEGAALTSYVGHFDADDRPLALRPQQRSLTVLPGEVLLLCSDGLTDYAASTAAALARQVQQTLAEQPELGRAARLLTAQANAGGGGDNITLLLARARG